MDDRILKKSQALIERYGTRDPFEIAEEDMDEIMHAMQEAYWEAKKNNRKYVNKRYQKEDSSES